MRPGLSDTSERADRARADFCFAMAEQPSEEAAPVQLPLVPSGRVPGASQGACSSRKAQVLPGRAFQPTRIRALLACEAVGLSAYEVSPSTGPRPAGAWKPGRGGETTSPPRPPGGA